MSDNTEYLNINVGDVLMVDGHRIEICRYDPVTDSFGCLVDLDKMYSWYFGYEIMMMKKYNSML